MPSKHPWRLSEVTLKDVRKHKYNMAVLPCGATEPHNLHLPYGTDVYEVEHVSDKACELAWNKGAKVALLPTMPYGCDTNLMEFPWTMNFDQTLLDQCVASIARSLEKHGIRKLVLVNGHGGNSFQGGIRSLHGKTSVFICVVDWYRVAYKDAHHLIENTGDHADEMETSCMLELKPELVDFKSADPGAVKLSRFTGALEGWVWYTRPWERLTTNTGVGDPRKGTAKKGKVIMDIAANKMSDFFVELSAAPYDKDFPFQAKKDMKPGKYNR